MSEEKSVANGETEGPWYNDGLQFTCTQCGDCCTGAPGVVWASDEELLEIAEYLDKPIGEIRLFHTRVVRGRVSLTEFANGDCTFFDPKARKCTVYRARPIQCRTWPFWNSHLESPAAWKRCAIPAQEQVKAHFSASSRLRNVRSASICRFPEFVRADNSRGLQTIATIRWMQAKTDVHDRR